MAFRKFTSPVISSVIPMRLVWNILCCVIFLVWLYTDFDCKDSMFRFSILFCLSPCRPWHRDRRETINCLPKDRPRRKEKACYFGSSVGI